MNEATSDYIWINDELNNFNQIIPRRYTLVHDPNISDLFLCINHEFMYQHLISSEFKLLGEWTTYDEKKYLYYIYIDVDFIHQTIIYKKGVRYSTPFFDIKLMLSLHLQRILHLFQQ